MLKWFYVACVAGLLMTLNLSAEGTHQSSEKQRYTDWEFIFNPSFGRASCEVGRYVPRAYEVPKSNPPIHSTKPKKPPTPKPTPSPSPQPKPKPKPDPKPDPKPVPNPDTATLSEYCDKQCPYYVAPEPHYCWVPNLGHLDVVPYEAKGDSLCEALKNLCTEIEQKDDPDFHPFVCKDLDSDKVVLRGNPLRDASTN